MHLFLPRDCFIHLCSFLDIQSQSRLFQTCKAIARCVRPYLHSAIELRGYKTHHRFSLYDRCSERDPYIVYSERKIITINLPTVKVWNMDTSKQILEYSITWPDNYRFFDSNRKIIFYLRTMCVLDSTTGRVICTMSGHKYPIETIQIFDYETKAMTSKEGDIFIWNLVTGQLIHKLRRNETYFPQIKIIDSSRRAIITTGKAEIAIWDLIRGCKTHTLKGHRHIECINLRGHFNPVRQIYVIDSERKCVSLSTNYIIVWDLITYKSIHVLNNNTTFAESLLFDSDTKLITYSDKNVSVWDIHNGILLCSIPIIDSIVYSVYIIDYCSKIACFTKLKHPVEYTGDIAVYNVSNGALLYNITIMTKYAGTIKIKALDSQHQFILFALSYPPSIYDVNTGECIDYVNQLSIIDNISKITQIGHFYYFINEENNICILDSTNTLKSQTLRGHDNGILDFEFFDSNRVIISTSQECKYIEWDLDTTLNYPCIESCSLCHRPYSDPYDN